MTRKIQIDLEKDLLELRQILSQKLNDLKVQVYLFGSRARREARTTSDIDVAILPHEPLPTGLLAEIREALEQSSIPFEVDLVDLSEASPSFRERVLKEGIPWMGCENG